MNKYCFKKLFFFFCLMLFFWLYLFSLKTLGQDSIIRNIYNSFESIVYVNAVNTLLCKSNPVAFKDSTTGQIIVADQVSGAKFERKGTGIIINQCGLIATNAHIVKDATYISVCLCDKTELEAKVVWIASDTDLAFIQVLSKIPLVPIMPADSDNINPGNIIYTVGSSEFLQKTISSGLITRVGRLGSTSFVELIQTNLNMYPGDSGAPLLDENGHLLGLLAASQTKRPYETIAIPSNKIKQYYVQYLQAASSVPIENTLK